MILKLFTQKNCPKCPGAKKVFQALKKKKIKGLVFEAYDTEAVEGMAEAAFYTVMSTPALLICDEKGREITGWRGEVPKEGRVKAEVKHEYETIRKN